MPRKSTMIGPLMDVLPPHSSKDWLFAFEVSAAHRLLRTASVHELLQRAVKDLKIAARRKDPKTGRWVYARAKAR